MRLSKQKLILAQSIEKDSDGIATFCQELINQNPDFTAVGLNRASLRDVLEKISQHDILILNGPYFWKQAIFLIFGKLLQKRTIVVNHGNISMSNRSILKTIYNRIYIFIFSSFIDSFIVTSDAEYQASAALNPVSLNLWITEGKYSDLQVSTPKKFILYSGRFSKEKRINLICEAFQNLDKMFDLQLCLCGEPRALYEDIAYRNITYFGELKRSEALALSRRAFFNINVSQSESFGYSIAESLMHGVPVIVSSESEWPVEKGFGFRIDPENRNEFLKLLDFINKISPQEYYSMKLVARKYYNENLTKKVNLPKWINEFEK